MGTDLDEDLMLTLIQDTVIDDLIATSRTPPSSLYFFDCELCQSPDLPPMYIDWRPESPVEEILGDISQSSPTRTAHAHEWPPTEITPQFAEVTISPVLFKTEIAPVLPVIKEDPEPPREIIAVKKKPELVVSDEAIPDTNFLLEYFKPAELHKPFACDWCRRVFPNRSKMKRHVQGVHLNLRPYPCEHCPKKFKRKVHLEKHLIRHIKESLLACKLCEIRSTKHACERGYFHTDVASHRIVCAACGVDVPVNRSDKGQTLCERPYKCPCGRCYRRKDSFRKHFRWCRAKPARFGERWSLRSKRPSAERSRGFLSNSNAEVIT